MRKLLQLFRLTAIFVVGAATPFSAGATTTFSITSGDFGPSSIPELPSLTEMVGNQFGAVDVVVTAPTEIGVYKLRQTNPVSVLENANLVLGGASFDMSTQSYNAAGTYLGAVKFSGDFNNSLGIYGFDTILSANTTFYYPSALTFYFGFDVPAGTESGTPPGVVAETNVLYLTDVDGGVYRLQAVPEPSTWLLLMTGLATLVLIANRKSLSNRKALVS